MINPTEEIKIKAMHYAPQFNDKPYGYCNIYFSVTPVSLETMYIIKYVGRDYQFALHPFKARVMQ